MTYYSLLVVTVVCSNNVSMLHCFWDITTSTEYATTCDREKSDSSWHSA